MTDLEHLSAFLAEYKMKAPRRFASAAAAIDVQKIEDEIRYIVLRNSNNRELVLKAVSADGWLLEYASDELKKDPEIVIAALKNNPNASQFVNDKEVLRQVEEQLLENNKSMGGR